MRAAVAVLSAVVVAGGPAASISRADGDPASDVLLLQNVYFPYRVPSPGVRAELQRAADAVYARGDRVKVALIYAVEDLGAIPSLFGQPAEYARFLGAELGLWYVGPLLVVMPAGFGVWDGGRSTAAEDRVLRAVPLSASSPDALARAATTALQRLAAADALRSPDVTAPLVSAHPASATRGKVALLHFDLFDDSGRSKALVRVYEDRSLVATLASPSGFGIGTRRISLRWRVPTALRSRRLRFCVVASDNAGNRSRPACATFLRVV
ncbi:MAG TPA: hypothetical protein VH760_02835 [Gaiellaceae bacterium]|jgi:hypothetical protein